MARDVRRRQVAAEPEAAGKRIVSGVALAAIAGFAAGLAASGWWRARMLADFWPPDRSSVGPNLLATAVQAGIAVGVLAVVYPPLRRWIEAEVAHWHAKADHQIDLLEHVIVHRGRPGPGAAEALQRINDRRPARGRAPTSKGAA